MRIKIFPAVMPELARSEVGTPALAGSRLWIFRLLIIIAAFWLLIIIAAWFCCMLMSSPRYLAHVLARRMIGALCRTILRRWTIAKARELYEKAHAGDNAARRSA